MACGDPPPPPAPPQPKAVPKPKPKPKPPKCESLKEACKAKKSTRIKVPETDYVFTPPKGWTYASLEEAAVVQAGDDGPVLVLTSFEPEKALKVSKQRKEMVESFASLVLIEPPKGLSLFKPNVNDKIAGLQMRLWEKPNAKRGDDSGALLILSAQLDNRELFGVGFAPKDDADGTDSILQAIKSLEKVGGGSDKDDSDKDDKGGK
jgi:hypothetical protein